MTGILCVLMGVRYVVGSGRMCRESTLAVAVHRKPCGWLSVSLCGSGRFPNPAEICLCFHVGVMCVASVLLFLLPPVARSIGRFTHHFHGQSFAMCIVMS